jgi:transcriptional regulator with XRE-family HTH domain
MRTLRQYIQSSKVQRTHAEWADYFGVSRSHFTEIVNGTARPSLKVISRINEATRGRVPLAVWLKTEAAE